MDYQEKLRLAKEALASGSYDKETIKYIFPELKESEDERIRKALINVFSTHQGYEVFFGASVEDILAWLEKQGKTSWKPSKEEMDVLYGLSYITNEFDERKEEVIMRLYQDLKREFFNGASFENMFPTNTSVELEKQGEKKPADKVDPKFKVGDTIRPKGSLAEYTIESISGECYHGKGWGLHISCDDDYELVEQKPADIVEPKYKAGDWVQVEHGNLMKILDVSEFTYTILSCYGFRDTRLISDIDSVSHLWTIQGKVW